MGSDRVRKLPDTNVWVAMTIQSHQHNGVVIDWCQRQAENSLFMCRSTQQGLLRIITTEKVFGDDAATNAEALGLLDKIRSLPFFGGFVIDDLPLEERWFRYADRPTRSPKMWMDAYLAALSVELGAIMVTFDRGFLQYGGVAVELLRKDGDHVLTDVQV